ncbi:MAG: amidohydrolase family protein [Phycisphaerae bacterium]
MGILLRHAHLVELDPPNSGVGDIRVDGAVIARVSSAIEPESADEIVDVEGAVVMPGLVNGHAHLYSALAVGMPAPAEAPRSFLEILERVWWRLDRALDAESLEVSATIGALDALRHGTTTVIDHHSSPNTIEGSLDRVMRGVDRVGLRGVLCYEVTDRNGDAGRAAGIEENRRFAEACRRRNDGRFGAMMGAHAGFTLSDEAMAEMARSPDLPLHIHVAEDPCDERISRARYGATPVERLDRHGLLNANALLAHAIHLSRADLARVQQAGATVAHCPQSNMNNRVGHAPVDQLGVPIALGTDGLGNDMPAEARIAWLKARDAGIAIPPQQAVAMLGTAQRTAGRLLGIRLGELRPGAAADLVVMDYHPATPLDAANLAGHVLFGMGAATMRHVMVAGRWAMFDRQVKGLDEAECRAQASRAAAALWARMSGIT